MSSGAGGQNVWDPDQVDIVIGGFTLEGFADGSILEFEEDGDRFVIVKGADGLITRSKALAKVATLTVHLMNTSRSNDVLSALHVADVLANGGAGIVPGLIRDKNGTTIYETFSCWVMGLPKDTMSDKAEDRPWKIQFVNYNAFLGGS